MERLDAFKELKQLEDNFVCHLVREVSAKSRKVLERNADYVFRYSWNRSVIKIDRYDCCFGDSWCEAFALKGWPNLLYVVLVEKADDELYQCRFKLADGKWHRFSTRRAKANL